MVSTVMLKHPSYILISTVGGLAQFNEAFPKYCIDTTSLNASSSTSISHNSSCGKLCLQSLKPRLIDNYNNGNGGLGSMSDSMIHDYTKPLEILPYLYLGNEKVAQDYETLRLMEIPRILCVAKEAMPFNAAKEPEYFDYMRLDLDDNDGQDLFAYFERTYKWIGTRIYRNVRGDRQFIMNAYF